MRARPAVYIVMGQPGVIILFLSLNVTKVLIDDAVIDIAYKEIHYHYLPIKKFIFVAIKSLKQRKYIVITSEIVSI